MSITINGSGDINATGNDIELNSTGTTDVTLALGGGSVGVGVASPTATLDVNGTIKLDGNHPVGTGNVALGDTALDSNVSGGGNTAIGADALTANTASNNTAVGYQAAYSNITSDDNTAVGYQALLNNTAAQNTAVGKDALKATTTAGSNTAVGYQAGLSNTTGAQITAIGYEALHSNTTGGYDTALGRRALRFNTTGSYNTALGVEALTSNTTASYSTAVGYGAGYSSVGAGNTFIGYYAGQANTASGGSINTFVGYNSGSSITSGEKNTILGAYSGNQGGLDIRTANNHIVLSDGDGNPRVWVDAGGGFIWSKQPTTSAAGIELTNTTHPYIRISGGSDTANRYRMEFINGNGTVGTITTSGSSTAYNTSSDYRLKENVVDMTGATERLKQLNPSRFNFIADADTTVDGFLAHEVQAVVPEAVTGTKDAVDDDGNPVYQGIDQSKLVPLLVATIKELEARITALETP